MDLEKEGAKLLAVLSEKLDRADLSFDDQGSCVFVLDRKLVFNLFLDDVTDELVIGVMLGVLPEGGTNASVLRRLLAANYYWRLTQGGTIGLDEASGMLALCYRVPLPLDEPAQVEEIVAKLAGAADHWMRELGDAVEASDRSGDLLIRA